MRAGFRSILPALLALLAAAGPAEARPRPGRPHHGAASDAARDMDRTLTVWAARERRHPWGTRDSRGWQSPRALVLPVAPATRERVAAPPFTGWGYGGTIPGAGPGF